ncbi:hypothetical protein F2Q70_00019485 [Brassica cretica]|uniref:Malectin-like domain-containing protein n=1 Tax=Brassica cretica TaxID=69181 RepID=A0A8S9GPE4_BRACR|nr:hypothetical protein F2Q70_00019485 [Brassica cretica]
MRGLRERLENRRAGVATGAGEIPVTGIKSKATFKYKTSSRQVSEDQTKMETFPVLCLIYSAAFALCLVASALAQDQSGFISIDCGIPSGSSYKDDTTGINYVSDSSFVETGVSKSVSFTAQRQLQTLRSFPEGARNCYTLTPKQGKGKKYVVRASFMYGNYDGENGSPEFDLFLGGNIWDTVFLTNGSVVVSKEVVYLSQTERIFVCLGNKGKGTPFMSTLELRFLGNDNTTYDSPNGALFFSRRWDFGSLMDSPVRYDEDVYDRIWIPRNFGYCREINTTLPVLSDDNSYNLSSLVMSTAMTPTNTTNPITMTLENSDPNVRYFAYIHFAEVEDLSLKPNLTREFDIRINGVTVHAAFSPKYLQTNTFVLNPESQTDIVFSLVRTSKSTLPPIINALEIYIANSFSQSLTNEVDVNAVTGVKTSYKVKRNWQGDPCMPNDYLWEGLNCSYDSLTPPRITSLNLSSSELTGQLSPSFSNLTMIQELGTETAEDLITDGLGRACSLTPEDMDRLANRIRVMDSSRTHYGHSGIVEAARDLFTQIEGDPGESGSTGFLSSLIGDGGECAGYSIRIVGHSLGGAIASLLGIRLRCRFPNLYVYAYGPLPCVDQDVAEACSEFVTSIVLDNEFSSRLSYGSIRRLQVAAIKVLSQDPKADTALIFRLARRFLSASKRHRQHDVEEQTTGEAIPSIVIEEDQTYPILEEAEPEMRLHDEEFINPFHETTDSPVSQFMETVQTRGEDVDDEAPELFLPGLVIHIVHEGNNMSVPIWRGWPICDVPDGYKAYVANRESFKEIMVSPSMFLDHLPWRCRHAMQKVLESRNLYCDMTSDLT